MQQHELSCLHTIASLKPIEVHSASKMSSIKSDGVVPCLPELINNMCNTLAERVVHIEFHMTLSNQAEFDSRCWVKGLG